MIEALRETGKRSAGWLLSRSVPRYRYRNAIFILAHMRCGSTALSNVLCSRPEVSGYGEAHVQYRDTAALGQLVLNQMRRGAWKPRADYLFDKILHSRHDRAVPEEFFQSRAIFLVRRPDEAIRSIVKLFARLERREYESLAEAAIYYLERLEALESLWRRFPRHKRIGFSHEELVADPDSALSAISRMAAFAPALQNRYASLAASRRGGGGDPLQSGRHTRIERRSPALSTDAAALDLPGDLAQRADQMYRCLVARFQNDRRTG